MKKLKTKDINWFTVFFIVVFILILMYWSLNVSKTITEDQKNINPLFIIGFALLVAAIILLMKKLLKFKFTAKKDNYHPENYSDHQEGKYRKNTR